MSRTCREASTRPSMRWKSDHAYLLKGDVFTEDVIRKWVEYKVNNELNPVRLRPVPHEFQLYFDI